MMTAEELLELTRKARSWNMDKIVRVFEGEGVYGYLDKHGIDKFVEKMNGADRLTIDDLKVGDVITCGNTICGNTRYVVLGIDSDESDFIGTYIFDGEETAWFTDSDLEDFNFKKTGESVAYYVNHIINALNLTEEDNPF